MVIHKLHIKNFKSFPDYEFDFDKIKGFWEISGVVGSGKTTIGEAILFALFGNVRQKNNTDFIAWGEKKAIVEISFESKQHNIYIKRTINHIGQCPIDVQIDGSPLEFTNKRNAQQILESEYYDISHLALELLCIISFNGFQSFSRMSAQDTKQFLDQVFGFRIISEYADLCKQELKKCQQDKQHLEIQIDSVESQIKKFNDWKNQSLISKDDIDSAKIEADAAKVLLDNYKKETESERKKILSETITLKQQLTETLTLGKQQKKEIDLLKKGICPTCGAPLDTSHLKEHEHERDKLLKQYSELDKKIKEIEKSSGDYAKKRQIQEKHLQERYVELSQQYTQTVHNFKHQEECDVQIESLQKELQADKKKLKKNEKDIQEWDDLAEFINNDIKHNILSSLIPHINHYIKSYMQKLHQPYLVEFDESFKCSINVSTVKDNISVTSLSTGQQKIVDVVIILAILKVLLSGVNFSVIMLDELFANLDENLRNEMCEILKENISSSQTMLVISHAPLNPQYMDGNIKVRMISGRSQIEILKS